MCPLHLEEEIHCSRWNTPHWSIWVFPEGAVKKSCTDFSPHSQSCLCHLGMVENRGAGSEVEGLGKSRSGEVLSIFIFFS